MVSVWKLNEYCLSQDERGRLMRRNIVRYAILAYVITLKHVSVRVKKRFPTLQHIVDAGKLYNICLHIDHWYR